MRNATLALAKQGGVNPGESGWSERLWSWVWSGWSAGRRWVWCRSVFTYMFYMLPWWCMLIWRLRIWGFGCVFQGFTGDRVLVLLIMKADIHPAMYNYIPEFGSVILYCCKNCTYFPTQRSCFFWNEPIISNVVDGCLSPVIHHWPGGEIVRVLVVVDYLRYMQSRMVHCLYVQSAASSMRYCSSSFAEMYI